MRKMMGKACTVVLMCSMAVACSGGSGSSSSGSSAPPDLTAEEAYREYFTKGCGLEERCANVRGRQYSSRAECEGTFALYDQLFLALTGKGYFAGLAEDFRVGDQARLRTCLGKIETVACTDQTVRDPDCEGVLVPVTPRTAGQSCVNDGENCDVGLFCDEQESKPTCSLCAAYKANGASCSDGNECDSGFCTSDTNGTCAVPAFKARGQACTFDDECVGQHVCAGAAGQKTCQERGGVGAACDGPEATNETRPRCMDDLECVTNAAGVTGTCSRRLSDGQPCVRRGFNDPTTSAPCATMCLFANATTNMGTCGFPAGPLAAGSPCAGFQGGTTALCSLEEESTLYADLQFNVENNMFNITGCTCKTQVANGQDCFFSSACSNGICTGTNFQTVMPGECSPKLANGTVCEDDSDCDSDYCAPGTGNMRRCAVKPSCP